MDYTPPTDEQVFALRVCAGLDELAQHPQFAEATPDMARAIINGIGQFAAETWAPLNRIGDRQGSRIEQGSVSAPEGFAQAYRAYVSAGWNAISGPVTHGGQGLPSCLANVMQENLGAANMAFTLLPMLTVGAIEALAHHGSEAQKSLYLPRLVSGEWSGTMNLTEPLAGSDVGALRTIATPIEEGEHAGKWRISGTKIFITWGDHDLAENIVHLVLARTPDAPAGSKGISLFIVTKYLVNPDGTPGPRNDLGAVSVEHKLGIHASPTCVMSYGDNGSCIGEMVGERNGGLAAMFTMMNSARINVGSQGLQLAERATQQAIAYARTRVQSARAGSANRIPVAIIEHPDVRRMVLRMRALTQGARALIYYCCGQIDRGALGDSAARQRGELLVPLVKSWGTEIGCEVTSLNIQVHGGMGYIEETGAAQHFRDARIGPIYEGTNGIQAADFVTRKLGYGDGGVLASLLTEIVRDAEDEPLLLALAGDCAEISAWMLERVDIDDRLAGSVPFQTMCAVAVAGWQLMRQARMVTETDEALSKTKPVIARWFLDTIVPEASGLKASALQGAANLYALDNEDLAR